MKAINKLITAVKVSNNKNILKLKKYSPDIFLGLGLTGMVVASVMACKATLDAAPILDKHNRKKKAIKEAREEAVVEEVKAKEEGREPEIIFSEKDMAKDLLNAKKELVIDLGKTYGASVSIFVVSTLFVLKAYDITKKRSIRYMGLYAASQKALNTYRKRTRERFGAEVDEELMTGAKKVAGTVTETDKDGNELREETEALAVDNETITGTSDYGVWFEEGATWQWQRNHIDNECFLMAQQAYFNQKLIAEGYVILAEVLKALGFKPTNESLVVGWIKDSPMGDNYISFGNLIPCYRETGDIVSKTGRITKGLSGNCYYLDFNVDGPIYGAL